MVIRSKGKRSLNGRKWTGRSGKRRSSTDSEPEEHVAIVSLVPRTEIAKLAPGGVAIDKQDVAAGRLVVLHVARMGQIGHAHAGIGHHQSSQSTTGHV